MSITDDIAIMAKMPKISGDIFSVTPHEMALGAGYAIDWTYPPVEEVRRIVVLQDYDMENLLAALMTWKRAKESLKSGGDPEPTIFLQDSEVVMG